MRTPSLIKQARANIPDTVSLSPPHWLNMYSDFVLENASSIGQIEAALRSLTYIIPGTLIVDARIEASINLKPGNRMLTSP